MPEGSMLAADAREKAAFATAIRIVMVFDTVALLIAAALHVQGARIPLGAAVFAEPQIVPAAIVEGLAGLIFALGCYAVFAGKPWAWASAVFAHCFAIAGFILGLWATRNGTTQFNAVYHRSMLVDFAAGLVLVLLPQARRALGLNARNAPRDLRLG